MLAKHETSPDTGQDRQATVILIEAKGHVQRLSELRTLAEERAQELAEILENHGASEGTLHKLFLQYG